LVIIMADNDIIHVAIEPQGKLDDALINTISEIINKNPWDTRLILAGEIPKIITHYKNIELANQTVAKINALGIQSLAIGDTELHRSSPSFKAQTLKILGEQIVFHDDSGSAKTVPANGIFLILVGRHEASVISETTTIKTKFDMAGTLLTGGIPMWRRVKEKNTNESIETTFFIRLYENNLSGTWIELNQKQINYVFLGKLVAPSTLVNFNTMLQQLRDFFPNSIYDDRLTRPSVMSESSSQPWHNLDAYCQLAYLFHRRERNSKPA